MKCVCVRDRSRVANMETGQVNKRARETVRITSTVDARLTAVVRHQINMCSTAV